MSSEENKPIRIDRRTTIRWVLAASAAMPLMKHAAFAADARTEAAALAARGYGTDPDLQKTYKAGDIWPLTFTPEQRRTAAVLCDAIIPADDVSPAASAVGVVDFIDEWISAPYTQQQADRQTVLRGFRWLDEESQRRFGGSFATVTESRRATICDDVCNASTAKPEFADASKFFALYRDLTAGGFYTTPAGTRDLQYVGNVPLPRFDGPPPEALRKAGLGDPSSTSN
jgi:hypothetical protein